jgi:hypothetical protein
MNRRIAALLTAPVLGAAVALAAASPAFATVPTASYSLYSSDQSWKITVITNPSNYGMQAEARCVHQGGSFTYWYGPWVFSPGVTSSISTNCDGAFDHGTIDRGFFRYKKSSPIRVTCWQPGLSRNGTC